MERLDKIIAGTGKYSRREVKELVRQGRVIVDGRLASSPEEKVDADAACLLVDGQSLDCRRYTYLMPQARRGPVGTGGRTAADGAGPAAAGAAQTGSIPSGAAG